MSKCEFCGEEAGLLRKSHKECKEKHMAGSERILDYATVAIRDRKDFKALDQEVHRTAQASFVDEAGLKSLLIAAWEKSVNQAMEDDALTKQEEESLVSFREHFALSQGELNQNGAYGTVVKGAIIRELLNGNLPQLVRVEGTLPFLFQKGESLVWVFQNVEYIEQRNRRQYIGSYSGVSVRMAKGVYYRTGGFRGSPVDTQESVRVDIGIFAVTNKHIYFAGSSKSFKIPYSKIVSLVPYSNGIGVQRDAATAKPQSFVTGDGWFTFNLLSNLAKMGAA